MNAKTSDEDGPPHPVEWIVGAISAVAIALLIGYLLWNAVGAEAHPPRFAFAVEDIEPRDGLFHVTVSVRNTGDETAAATTVRGELSSDGKPAETSELFLDYLPPNSVRRGTLLFRNDPAEMKLDLAVTGYSDP